MQVLTVPEWNSALPPSFLGSEKEAWTNRVEDTRSFLCLIFKKSDWPEIIVAFKKLLWVLGSTEGSIRPGQQRVVIHVTAF